MSAETELHATLSGAAGVSALVGDRIYPDGIPLTASLPAIAYQRTATEFATTIHGGVIGETPTLEITCVAEARAAANAVANAVVAALAGTEFVPIDQQAAADLEAGEQGLWGALVFVTINL